MPRVAATILVALLAAMIIPGTAFAAKAERSSWTLIQLICSELRSDGDSAQVAAWITDQGETYADLQFWEGPAEPGQSQPTWYGYGNASLIGEDGTSLQINFTVYELGESEAGPAEPSPVGEATLTATLDPAGDAETYADRYRYGNHQYRSSGSWQALSVSGELLLPDATAFALTGCEADRYSESFFANAPAKTAEHTARVNLVCTWSADAGVVTMYGEVADHATSFGLWVEGPEFLYGDGSGSMNAASLEASFDLLAWRDDDETHVGRASASAVLARGERFSQTMEFGDSRYTSKGAWLIPDGSLTVEFPLGTTTTLAIDQEHCLAADIHSSQLPPRHERVEPVENDAPESAIPLKLGDMVTVSTADTQEAPEAPCVFTDEDGTTYEGPLTNTVWWRIEGTGSSITVDTVGSTFDTMVAVYLADGTAVGEPQGCVDDVADSLAARITFETVTDSSYLIQTGGFGGSTGDLTVAISEP